MAIKIYPNRIEFEKYSLIITSTGLLVTNNADASNAAAYGTFTARDSDVGSHFQGTNAGINMGVYGWGVGNSCCIQRMPFSTEGLASCIGTLSTSKVSVAGASSKTHGYALGGQTGSASPSYIKYAHMDKFPFVSGGCASNIGSLVGGARERAAGLSSTTHGFAAAGGFPAVSVIDKFPFSTDGSSQCIGNTSNARQNRAGFNSYTHGYVAGGGPPDTTTIEKFNFALNSGASGIGNLTCARDGINFAVSSSTYGYIPGGVAAGPVYLRIVDKVSYASDNPAVSAFDTCVARIAGAGFSSTSYGYFSGGTCNNGTTPAGNLTTIERFPFAADVTGVCVGSLPVGGGLTGSGQF